MIVRKESGGQERCGPFDLQWCSPVSLLEREKRRVERWIRREQKQTNSAKVMGRIVYLLGFLMMASSVSLLSRELPHSVTTILMNSRPQSFSLTSFPWTLSPPAISRTSNTMNSFIFGRVSLELSSGCCWKQFGVFLEVFWCRWVLYLHHDLIGAYVRPSGQKITFWSVNVPQGCR